MRDELCWAARNTAGETGKNLMNTKYNSQSSISLCVGNLMVTYFSKKWCL